CLRCRSDDRIRPTRQPAQAWLSSRCSPTDCYYKLSIPLVQATQYDVRVLYRRDRVTAYRTLRCTAVSTALTTTDWGARRDAHRARVRAWTQPHQQRRARGEKHPVL